MIRKSQELKRTRLVFLGILFIVLLGGTGWAVFHYQHPADYVIKIKSWMAERKLGLHQGLVKAKQIAVNKPHEEPPVHFEFYTTLPNMPAAESLAASAPVSKPIKSPIIIVSADELEQELADTLEHPTGAKK